MRIGVPAAVARADDLGDLVRAADVAGVQAHAVRARVDRLERQRVVEVDVGDDRDRRLAHDRLQRLDVLVARHRDAHDVRPGVRHLADLLHRGGQVGRLRLGHRLDDDRGAAADLDAAHVHVSLGSHCHQDRRRRHRHPAAGALAGVVHGAGRQPERVVAARQAHGAAIGHRLQQRLLGRDAVGLARPRRRRRPRRPRRSSARRGRRRAPRRRPRARAGAPASGRGWPAARRRPAATGSRRPQLAPSRAAKISDGAV